MCTDAFKISRRLYRNMLFKLHCVFRDLTNGAVVVKHGDCLTGQAEKGTQEKVCTHAHTHKNRKKNCKELLWTLPNFYLQTVEWLRSVCVWFDNMSGPVVTNSRQRRQNTHVTVTSDPPVFGVLTAGRGGPVYRPLLGHSELLLLFCPPWVLFALLLRSLTSLATASSIVQPRQILSERGPAQNKM